MRLKKHLLPVVIVLTATLWGCESNFDEINENPNNPTEALPENIMPRAQQSSMDRLYSMSGMNGYIGSIWVQHFAKIQYPDEDRYNFSGRVPLVNNIWESFYAGTLEDLNQIININAESENPDTNTEAMAQIMMAWNFQVATDLWGDIPYSEALQGRAEDPINSPAYDPQEEIYAGLLSDLEEAADLIDTGSSPFGSGDLIYGGDMELWQKLANSLRLRLAMRMSEVDPETAESVISDIYESGDPVFTSNQDIAELTYQPYPYNNPVNEFSRTREDHKISQTILDWLDQLDDPRLRVYATPVRQPEDVENGVERDGEVYNGVENATADLPGLGEASTMGAYFLSPESPGVIMTYAEVEFIWAEAAARGWIPEDPEEHYENAITASMEMYNDARLSTALSNFPGDQAFNHQGLEAEEFPEGISDDEISEYLSQADVTWDDEGWEEQLAVQKWLSLYGQGAEAWYEWRRLDYPELEPGSEAILDEVPVRLNYPQLEQSLNEENYSTAVDRQGEDNLLTPVWWDVE